MINSEVLDVSVGNNSKGNLNIQYKRNPEHKIPILVEGDVASDIEEVSAVKSDSTI